MLAAGRELDCLIAVHVMGAKHSEAVEREWMHFPETGPFADCDCDGHMAAQICPHYSTDIAAAWEVLEKIKQDGTIFPQVTLIRLDDNAWQHRCEIWKNDGNKDFGWLAEEYAPTLPLAICRAALKAVGYEPKETA